MFQPIVLSRRLATVARQELKESLNGGGAFSRPNCRNGMNRRLHFKKVIQRTGRAACPPDSPLCTTHQADHAAAFQHLQRRLMRDRLRSVDDLHHATHVKWASDEASSLSWATGFPLLFFPSLFEEKSRAALARLKRQDEIHTRSRELLGLQR
jgi:hypothetical protein